MTTLTYKEQLLHPNWQRKRLDIMQRDKFVCQSCFEDEKTLHVHHKRYVKGRMAWEYPDSELVTLCWPCHEIAHEESDEFKELIAQLPIDGPGCVHNAIGLVAGWGNGQQGLNLSRYMNIEPFNFVLGEIVTGLGWKCNMDVLMELSAAIQVRDPLTVNEAIKTFVLDLQTRANSVPPLTPEGYEPL